METFLCKNIFCLSVRNYKAQFGHAIKIYYVWILILLINILINSAIWLVNAKPQDKQMYCQISPRITCIPCGYTMKMSSRYHRLLVYDVKRTTKMDGMGLFKCTNLFRLVTIFPH